MNYFKLIFIFLIFTNSIYSWASKVSLLTDTLPIASGDSILWKRFGNIYERDTLYGSDSDLPKRFIVQNLNKGVNERIGLCYQLLDRSYLWIIDHNIQNYTKWKEIRYFFPEMNNLEIFLSYTDSSFVKSISLRKLKEQLDGTHSELYLHLNFNEGTSFKDSGSQVFLIHDLGYFEIYFHPNNQMKSIAFYPISNDYQSYQIEFSPDLTIKSYGYLFGNCPVGTWNFYDENGVIEKITENELIDSQHIEKVIFERKR